MKSRINTMVLHSDDRLTLMGSLHAELLMVHLGRPGPSVECGSAYDLTYDAIELISVGELTVTRNGKTVWSVSQQEPRPETFGL